MKRSVAWLIPFIEEKSAQKDTRAAAKSFSHSQRDVHDIGKNIVSVVLSCNNYEVVESAS